jgi:hypothetical protein
MEAPKTNIFDRSDVKVFFVQYPHLEQRLMPVWGTVSGRNELMKLLTDNRDGERQGFLPHFADAIMALIVEHDRKFPGCDQAPKTDIVTYRFDRKRLVNDADRNSRNEGWPILKPIAIVGIMLGVAVYLIKHKELLNGLF